jgi:TonB-like protein
MRLFLLSVSLFACCTCVVGQGDKAGLIYIKHLEPPRAYPPLARSAQLQGTVIVRLKIAADGTVLAADASSDDPLLKKVPLLQASTVELVMKWTFGCFNCAPGVSYEHTIRFVYALEGTPKDHDDSRVVLELPNDVRVTATPPLCDHCPPPTKSNGKIPAKQKGRISSIP